MMMGLWDDGIMGRRLMDYGTIALFLITPWSVVLIRTLEGLSERGGNALWEWWPIYTYIVFRCAHYDLDTGKRYLDTGKQILDMGVGIFIPIGKMFNVLCCFSQRGTAQKNGPLAKF